MTDTLAPRLPAHIVARMTAAGLRRTLATRVVLGLFLGVPDATLTHTQVASLVQARGVTVNRVTLYRLLDRLVACGVLRRQTDHASRSWRFVLARDEDAEAVIRPPSFECDLCHRSLWLDAAGSEMRAWAGALLGRAAAQGHRGTQVELAIRGICADCDGVGAGGGARA